MTFDDYEIRFTDPTTYDVVNVTTGATVATAAYVSGSVALILQRRPQFTPVASKRLLENTSRDLGQEGKDREFGAGLIDTLRALHTLSN